MVTHLCFHGIGVCTSEREPGESRYWITPDTFRRVLDEAAAIPGATLSFDDGNRSDVDIALPELRARGMTAMFFPCAGRIGDSRSLDATDLRELVAAGMTVGSHGWDHIPWRGLPESVARRELVDARRAIAEASGAEVTTAALPLGRYDRACLARLRDAGYRTVYTSDAYRSRAGDWLQARYSVRSTDDASTVRSILHRGAWGAELRNWGASTLKRLR